MGELKRLYGWMTIILEHRLRFLVGDVFHSITRTKALKEPTVWYRTPFIYQEKNVEYHPDWLPPSEYL